MSEQNLTIIRPKSGWFDLPIKELFRYKDLILLFVKRDFVSLYKQTILGPAWAVIQPFLTTEIWRRLCGKPCRKRRHSTLNWRRPPATCAT